jgi:hypothetical protein
MLGALAWLIVDPSARLSEAGNSAAVPSTSATS